MIGRVNITLTWDESHPGWVATGKLTVPNDQIKYGPRIELGAATSEIVRTNPMAGITDVVDAVCRQAGVHPATIESVTVRFPANELYDTRDRTTRT
jgi:hypothetical protein